MLVLSYWPIKSDALENPKKKKTQMIGSEQ
jgi:hypothetical protein